MTEKLLYTGCARKVDGGWDVTWAGYLGGNFSSAERPTEEQARAVLAERLGKPADSLDVRLDHDYISPES